MSARWCGLTAAAMLACAPEAPPVLFRPLVPQAGPAASTTTARSDQGAGLGQTDRLDRLHIGRSPVHTVLVGWHTPAGWRLRATEGEGWGEVQAPSPLTELPAILGNSALVGTLAVAGQTVALAAGAQESGTWRMRTRAGHTTVLRDDGAVSNALEPNAGWQHPATRLSVTSAVLDRSDVPWAATHTLRTIQIWRWFRGNWREDKALPRGRGAIVGVPPELNLVPLSDGGVVVAHCTNGTLQLHPVRTRRRFPAVPASATCGTAQDTPSGLVLIVSRTDHSLELLRAERGEWQPLGEPLARSRTSSNVRLAVDPDGGFLAAWTEALGRGPGDRLLQTGLPQGIYAARWTVSDGWTGLGPQAGELAGDLGLGAGGQPMLSRSPTGEPWLGIVDQRTKDGLLHSWAPDGALPALPVAAGAALALAQTSGQKLIAVGSPGGVAVHQLATTWQPLATLPPPPRPVGRRSSGGPVDLFGESGEEGALFAADWRTDGSLDKVTPAGAARSMTTGGRVRALSGGAMLVETQSSDQVLRIPGEVVAAPLPCPEVAASLGTDLEGRPLVGCPTSEGWTVARWVDRAWAPVAAPPLVSDTTEAWLGATGAGDVMLRRSDTGNLWLHTHQDGVWKPFPGSDDGEINVCSGPCGGATLSALPTGLCVAASSLQADGPRPVLWCEGDQGEQGG